MKRLCITLVAGLFITSIQAQDIKQYLSMSKQEATDFANKINSQLREPHELFEMDQNGTNLYVRYIPVSTPPTDKAKAKDRGLMLSGVPYHTVQFSIFMEGKDEDLEIEGVERYKFLEAKLKFLDVVNVWEKFFFNGATLEDLRAKEKMERLIEGTGNKALVHSADKGYWYVKIF